jgi:hypothetical protein
VGFNLSFSFRYVMFVCFLYFYNLRFKASCEFDERTTLHNLHSMCFIPAINLRNLLYFLLSLFYIHTISCYQAAVLVSLTLLPSIP